MYVKHNVDLVIFCQQKESIHLNKSTEYNCERTGVVMPVFRAICCTH